MTNIKCLISGILIMGGVAAALADESAQTTIQVESCGCIKIKPGTLKFNCTSIGLGCTEINYSSVADLKRKWREGKYARYMEGDWLWGGTSWDNNLVWDLEEENGTIWLVPYVIKANIKHWHNDATGSN